MKNNRARVNGEPRMTDPCLPFSTAKAGANVGQNPDPNPPPPGTAPARRLPLMKHFEDAAAISEKENDPFYLAAFMIQCWLGGLALNAAAEYAEKKNPKDRSLQSGQAWRAFLEMFPFTEAKGFRYVLSCLFRFAASDDSPGNSLRRALIPLSIEHHCTGDSPSPEKLDTVSWV
jgi:hypothetical protein